MKLRRNTGAKIAIGGAAAGLLLAFLGLVRADPRLHAQEQAAAPATNPAPDYRGFFVPGSRERDFDDDREHQSARQQPTTPQTSPQSQSSARVHTRTRAS